MKAAQICGDLIFPNRKERNFSSEDQEEQSVLELFENVLYQQGVDFHTRGTNTLDVAFFRNCSLFASPNEVFAQIYDCSDHKAVKLSLEFPNSEEKPIIGNFRSCGSADYPAINELLEKIESSSKCYTDINQMCEEMYDSFDRIVEALIPRRTRHRQLIPPWITSSRSNLLNKLTTQRKLLLLKPTTCWKMQAAKLQNNVIEAAEIDWTNYQIKTMSARDRSVIFKHLKILNKSLQLAKVMIEDGKSASCIKEKVNFLNDFFPSVYSPKKLQGKRYST